MPILETKDSINIQSYCLSEYSWKVILFNCNCHTFDFVVERIIEAIKCTSEKASQLANVADQFGSVVIFVGKIEKCEKVADILGSGGLEVKISV